MFETAVRDGSDQFRLEQEVVEARRVDGGIRSLRLDLTGRGGLLAVGGDCASVGIIVLDFIVGVVDEIFFVRHDGGCVVGRAVGFVG